jgi:hypothetical protein
VLLGERWGDQILTAEDFMVALDLPAGSRVDLRVPKKVLLEHGAPTATDKRHITEGVEELVWLAALKPANIGVTEYRDEVREYLEIAVMRLTLRAGAKAVRLVELTHRAIPYPVLLLTEQGAELGLSAAHKRWSQGESAKTVLDGEVVSVEGGAPAESELWSNFGSALALGRQPRATLYVLYQGWIDTLLALQAARMTGVFSVAANLEVAASRRAALRECARLDVEIARIRAAASKERQMARRVDLNLELKRVEAARAVALAGL